MPSSLSNDNLLRDLCRTKNQNLERGISTQNQFYIETQTDMNNVSLSVDHDVSVVAILDLQDVTCDRVRSHGLDEVQARALERDGVLSSIFSDEEIE